MNTFSLRIDRLFTAWQRHDCTVDYPGTREELIDAINAADGNYENVEGLTFDMIDWDYLAATDDAVTREDNKGEPVHEIMGLSLIPSAPPSPLAALEELVDQLKCIGIPEWHGAEGLDLTAAEAAIASGKATV